jgi:2-succinyl-6-hydroxy-2,4-cyclohexadiene-1-carboxylate synthase
VTPVTSSSVARDIYLDLGDDLRLHVARRGAGPALVLIHGFTGSAGTWAELSTALESRYSILSLDLPGHGKSSTPASPQRYALDRFADDLARTLDILEIERAACLGYSMGGRAALRFALRHPDRIRALVLESTSPGIADSAERAEREESDHALAQMLERQGIEDFVDYWEQLPIWKSQKSLSHEARTRLREQRLAGDARGLANSIRGAGAGADPSVMDRLFALEVPTLLIAGALDEKYAAASQRMKASLPHARVAIVENAGHAVHLEQPEIFADLVAAFLDEQASNRVR